MDILPDARRIRAPHFGPGDPMTTDRARTLRKQMPPAEARMWNALRSLRPLGFHFRRQVPLGPYYADFASHHPKLVIELDGDTHASSAQYDAARDTFIRGEGYRVVRIPNHEVMSNLDGVMTAVMLKLGTPEPLATPTLNPSPQGGGRRRSRKIVEVGRLKIEDLPPPMGSDPSAISLPLMGRDQGWGRPHTPASHEDPNP